MASNKDVLEGQRFNRRRLVTAFASGTPGGRELEYRSSLRPLAVGAVVAVVILVVAAVLGRFSPTLPEKWQNSTLVIVKGTGARYYTINGTLRPVTNITSAKLLSQSGSYQTSSVPDSVISGIPRGSQVGLTGSRRPSSAVSWRGQAEVGWRRRAAPSEGSGMPPDYRGRGRAVERGRAAQYQPVASEWAQAPQGLP